MAHLSAAMVFEKILGTRKPHSGRVSPEVQQTAYSYDQHQPSPLLGRYGNNDGREYQQYSSPMTIMRGAGCPFAKLAQTKVAQIEDRSKRA